MYLKGYYGYKNFGDEILLLGLLDRLERKFSPHSIFIEAGEPQRLQERLQRHKQFLGDDLVRLLRVVPRNNMRKRGSGVKVFGGGEVFTDARPLPYNGRNYVVGFFSDVLLGNYHIIGGIGTIKKDSTKQLYSMLLGKAKSITVREEYSYEIASTYNHNVTLYHDFAYDVLEKLQKPSIKETSSYHIINVNSYIRNEETKQKIISYTKGNPNSSYRFVPGEIGSDDSFYELLRIDIPSLAYYDWTTKTIHEIAEFFSSSQGGIAARLHILLLLKYFEKPLIPLVYQEKVKKIIGE